MNKIREVEDWIATCRGTRDHFISIWSPWIDYIYYDPRQMSSSLDLALLELAEPSLRTRNQPGQ